MNTSSNPAATSVDEVIALLRALCQPLPPERIPLGEALNRVLREAIGAPEDQPAFDRSSVDGFAVRWDDPGPTFQIVDDLRAGDWKPRQIQPGDCVRIATGGALPCADLRVVMKEDAAVEGPKLRVLHQDASRNIRFRGEDAREGQTLLESGTVLRPGPLGLLASLGHTRPLVTRRPHALHLATGNEIIPPDQTPQPGQIRDSNSTLVRAFLQEWGVLPTQRRIPEDPQSEICNLQSEIQSVDLLLISGGASVGEHDGTRRLLERLGYDIRVSKTNARPGKPLLVAQRGDQLAFGLPGNPLAHFVCLNLFVRVALEAWSGTRSETSFRRGVLASDLEVKGQSGEVFWPAYAHQRDDRVWLTPLRWSSSGDLTALATANALLRLRAEGEKPAVGGQVDFLGTMPGL